MKSPILITFIILLVASTINLQAQSDVPTAVQTSFEKMYPNAEDVYWDEEVDGIYTVYFFDGAHTAEAIFRQGGEWNQTSFDYTLDELPEAAQNVLLDRFDEEQGFYAKILRLEAPDLVQYHVSFDMEERTIDLVFNEEGELVRRG